MGRLSEWASNGSTQILPVVGAPFQRLVFSPVSPTQAQLNAVSAAELADGWPQSAVTLAAAQRVKLRKLWIGKNGILEGDDPTPALMGGGIIGMRYLVDNEFVAERMIPNGNPTSSGWAAWENTVGGNFWRYWGIRNHWTLSSFSGRAETNWPGVFRIYFNNLFGPQIGNIELGKFEAFRSGGAAAGDASLPMNWVRGLAREDSLVVVTQLEGLDGANQPVLESFAVRYPSPPGLEGIRYMVFANTMSGGSVLGNQSSSVDPNVKHRLAVICAEPVWKKIYQNWGVSLVVTNDQAVSYTRPSDRTKIDFVPAPTERVQPPCLIPGLPKTIASSFNPLENISYHEVFMIGQPSISTKLLIDGEFKETAGVTTLHANRVAIEWSGKNLADMQPDLSVADKTELSGSLMRTALFNEERIVPFGLLEKLTMYQPSIEAGVDLAAEIVVEAEGDKPALTLGVAAKRAEGKKYQMFHQVIPKADPSVQRILVLSGSHTAIPSTLAYSMLVDGVATTVPSEDAIYHIRRGLRVYDHGLVSPTTRADAFQVLFGVTSAEMFNTENTVRHDDFDEVNVFTNGWIPDPRSVGEARASAQYIVQFAHDRSAMNTVVAAGVVAGRSAVRMLV